MCSPHVCVALLVLGSPAALRAQAPLDAAVHRLRPGQMIRVRTLDQGRAEGRLLTLQDNVLRLQRDGSPDVPVANIESLWVRGRATATGAIVGGLALGLTFGYVATGVCNDEGDCGGVEVPAATAVGLAGGALVGGLIGAAIPKWKLRYPRKRTSVGFEWSPRRPPALALTYRF